MSKTLQLPVYKPDSNVEILTYLSIIIDDKYINNIEKYTWELSYSAGLWRVSSRPIINKKRKTITLHKFIWELENGIIVDKTLVLDHINHNSLDNRLSNLRLVTQAQNQANRRNKKNSTSSYKGVSWSSQKNKWKAQIKLNGKVKHLGYFSSEKEAAIVYDKAVPIYFGEYGFLNFKGINNG